MAEELPADHFRPPDPAMLMPKHNIHSPLLESSSESSYNSSQVREEATHSALAGKELDGTRTNIYMEESRSIGGTKTGVPKSQDIQDSQKSLDFTIPFARNVQATEARSVGESPQIRHQNQTTGEVIRDEYDTGDCSNGRGGSIIGNSSTFHGEIAGRAPGDFTETPVKNFPNLKQAAELQLLAKTQNQYREGKKQSRDTGIPNDKSHNTAIPIASLNPGNELNQKENDQRKVWIAKEHGKVNDSTIGRPVQVPTANTNNARSDHPLVNSPNPHKTDPLAAPAPYTVVQIYVDRLRYNQAKCDTPINLTTPEITTKQGLPAVLYGQAEYNRKPTTTGQDNTNQQLQVDIIATQLEEHDDKWVNKGNKVKVPPDDYGALNSKDEIDPDNQSVDESDEDAKDTMQQTGIGAPGGGGNSPEAYSITTCMPNIYYSIIKTKRNKKELSAARGVLKKTR
ncbi:hypothetical protein KY284_037621 [Solanum tuberosum]|nr:hypothetical protein KY284_037621 [Solanum tuberosum]